jgi:hypothetical protein
MTSSNKMTVYRQGDVWIYKITHAMFTNTNKRPVPRSRKLGIVLAEGEVTGHHHRIPTGGRLYETGNGARLLSVPSKPVALVHEEHETIMLPPGHYEVRIQREYEPSLASQQTYVRD